MSEEGIYKIFIECSGDLHTFITEHDFNEYQEYDQYLRKAIDSFGTQWGNYPEKCKYKFEDDKKWKEIEVKDYVF
jgi:hypothetical protein